MKVVALRQLTVQGRRVVMGEVFELPHSLALFVKLGWVQVVEEPPPPPKTRVKPAPETRVEPKPVTRTKTKPKKPKAWQ